MDAGDEYYCASLHRDTAGRCHASARCLNRVAAAARHWEPLQGTALAIPLHISYIIQRKIDTYKTTKLITKSLTTHFHFKDLSALPLRPANL
ncbi:hypothetical protein E2C01_017141 [Portunus trituberculatus]|uniref:Uncharacterized protein n=1 Tax=Portunus trituberculatus TaxID=210409 RepID=A0A5B7DSM8_PORTR|nr:hypothetical protein [Portunus trituberculatus]